MGSRRGQLFLNVTNPLDLISLYTKYHQNISKDIRVIDAFTPQIWNFYLKEYR